MVGRTLLLVAGIIGLVLGITAEPTWAVDSLKTTLIASGFTKPVYMCTAPGDTSRLFVLEKRGIIWLINNGVRQAAPFMNCTTLVNDKGDERGFAGMVFHPNFRTNGYFYVDYNREGDSAEVVGRFHMSDINATTCSPSTQTVMLVIPQPGPIHKGGMMEFGPWDNYLYISTGDGTGLGDTTNTAQDSTLLLGKILRVDPNKSSTMVAAPDNPFVNRTGWRPEIWSLGFRNPWRMSFDRGTGDLWIGDVGQYSWEEIDYQKYSSLGGANYGWHFKEGFHCYLPSSGCNSLGYNFTDPIVEYSHDSTCAIVGGYVYQGCAMPWLRGTYFYADYCGGVWSMRYGPSGVYEQESRTAELGLTSHFITSFAQDERSELYVLTYDGGIYKIVPRSGQSACSGCCIGLTGNVNGTGLVDLSDLVLLVQYLTVTGTTLSCKPAADLNGTGVIDLSDLSALVAYLTTQPVLRQPCR